MSIPFLLQLIAGVVIVLIILLIFLIKKKRKNFVVPVLILTCLAIGFGVWKGLQEYNRTNKDLITVEPDLKISTIDLIHGIRPRMPINNSPYLSFLPVTLSSSQNRVQVVSKKKIGSATALAGAVEEQSND